MITQLNGQINVDSTPGEITTFTVILPELSITEQRSSLDIYKTTQLKTITKPIELENTASNFDAAKQTIMIIDDDPSMLWFVSEIFIDKYNVLSLIMLRMH